MQIKSAEFLISNTNYKKCPLENKPEYAFIGRSNVGKSSLINMLTSHKDLAKTSSQPGKTQLINHFLINGEWYLVDLPGYGYARSSKTNREKWQKMILDYIKNRNNLVTIFVLVDSRIPPQTIDVEFINFLGEIQIPFVIVFTKTDKNKQQETAQTLSNYKKKLMESWEELPLFFLTSSETKYGKDRVLDYIELLNKDFKGQMNINN